MNTIENNLQKIGFSDKKARIYLAILELGETSAIAIAKKTNLKRTSIYNILPELLREGLIKSTISKKRRIFFVEDLRPLQVGLSEKLNFVEKIIPELQAVHNLISYKPKITFYEGSGGMKDLYQDTLKNVIDGGVILSFTGLSKIYEYVPRDFAEAYFAERVKKKIRVKVIAPVSDIAQEWQKNALKDLREMKIINNTQFQFKADMEIYANKVALISYKEDFLGVIIESQEINQMMKAAFGIMWDALI